MNAGQLLLALSIFSGLVQALITHPCRTPMYSDNWFCLNTTNPIATWNSVEYTFAKDSSAQVFNAGLVALFPNATGECLSALALFSCQLHFPTCYTPYPQATACNSTITLVNNTCGMLLTTDNVGKSFTLVENSNPTCPLAYQPTCQARVLVQAGDYASPYPLSSTGGNYSVHSECDLFTYKNTDLMCLPSLSAGNNCTTGTAPKSWYSQLYENNAPVCNTNGVYTQQGLRNGAPCNDATDCYRGVCTNGFCVENEGSCTVEMSIADVCKQDYYCNGTYCVPKLGLGATCSPIALCKEPYSCAYNNGFYTCTAPAALGNPCTDAPNQGFLGMGSKPFCGPVISNLGAAMAKCNTGQLCFQPFYVNYGDPCDGTTNLCNPFDGVCNSGTCYPAQNVSCNSYTNTDIPCTEYQYCDCNNGSSSEGVCRKNDDHPIIACESEYIALWECLRSKCNVYKNAYFKNPYTPFDGFSCGSQQCDVEQKAVYCCTVDLNDGIPLSGLSYTCPTPSPSPTPTPTTTVAPTTTTPEPTTTTPEPTTTAAPTTTIGPTTTIAPTTTPEPTTSATPTTTTSAPTTAVPTTTAAPTTTAPPTTAAPTTAAPTIGPTSPPVSITTTATIIQTVVGDSTKIPPPVVANSVVLYSTANATVVVPLTFKNDTKLPERAIVQEAKVTFRVTYVQSAVTMVVFLTDEYGEQAGNVTTIISAIGIASVDIAELYARLVAENSREFIIRAIRGSILKVSLSAVTADVPINLDPSSVSSTITYSLQETPTPSAAPTTAPSSVPTTTKPSLSGSTLFDVSIIAVILSMAATLLY